jgi:hypothetical protein
MRSTSLSLVALGYKATEYRGGSEEPSKRFRSNGCEPAAAFNARFTCLSLGCKAWKCFCTSSQDAILRDCAGRLIQSLFASQVHACHGLPFVALRIALCCACGWTVFDIHQPQLPQPTRFAAFLRHPTSTASRGHHLHPTAFSLYTSATPRDEQCSGRQTQCLPFLSCSHRSGALTRPMRVR